MESPICLGFDCRDLRPGPVAARWGRKRRDGFLLDPELACPISVDSSVLPSVLPDFNMIPDELAPIVACAPLGWEWRVLARTWPCLEDMAEILRRCAPELAGEDALLLEIELLGNERIADHPTWQGALSLPPVAGRSDARAHAAFLAREALGHDVADSARISALMNCGYLPEEASDLRRHWTARLNRHGLIATLDQAREFAELSDRRVKEHAPFAVFALYRWRLPPDAIAGSESEFA